MLLAVGAIVVTQVNGRVGAARAARRTAKTLIAQAVDEKDELPRASQD